MSYGLKYYFSFDDIHPLTKATWKVNISFKDYTGASTEITDLGAKPLTFLRGQQSDDKFEPILGSEADMTIVITDESVVKPDDFIFIDEDAALVEIYKNAVLYWKGFIKQDFIQFAYTAPPYEFTIPATDRIALMKSELLDIQDDINDDGFVLLSDLLLTKGLYKTNLCSQLKLLSSLIAPSPSGIVYPDPGGVQLSFLDQLKIRYELLIDSTGNPMNVYDTLVMLARSFGARIFYNGGYYHFQRVVDMFTEKPLVAIYTDKAYPDSRAAVAIRKTLKGEISSADGIYANNDAFFQIEGAHKQEKMDLTFVQRGYLLNYAWASFANGDFAHWSGSHPADGLEQHGDGSIENPYSCFFKPNPSGDSFISQFVSGIIPGQQYTLKFSVKFFGMSLARYEVHIFDSSDPNFPDFGSKTHFYLQGNTWKSTDGTGDAPQNEYNIHIERPGDIRKNEVDINMTLPAIPNYTDFLTGNKIAPNTMYIVLLDPVDEVDDGTADADRGVEWGAITLGLQAYGYTGEIDSMRSSANYSILNENDDGKIIDALDAFANAIHYGDQGVFSGDNGYWQDSFFNNTTLEAYLNAQFGPAIPPTIARVVTEAQLRYETIQRRTLREILNENGKPSYKLTTSVFSNTLEFENVIQQAYGSYPVYAQMYDEYDVKNCLHKLQLLQLISAAGYTGTPKTQFKF